ncbi:MAG: DUF29 family protein [Chloroflexi bacterium]|nr:MAG: DUF29 family protein [Chloroflexota bacterium]
MEELFELREHIQQGRYDSALLLIGEMEEMSQDDKINKLGSFVTILLLHLIKQQAEGRSTRSWEISIRNAAREIIFTNKRRKAGGYYMRADELREIIDERYVIALSHASLEAFEGIYSPEELDERVNESAIKEEALGLILQAQTL